MQRWLAALVAIPFYQSPHSLFPSGEASSFFLNKNKLSIQKEASLLVEKDRRQFWLSTKDVVRDSDLTANQAITITSTQIRENDSWKSGFKAHIPARSRLQVLRFKDTWAEVNYDGVMRGWVDLNNLIIKADFASFIQVGNEWHTVKYREGPLLVAENSQRYDINRVTAMKTKPDLAISVTIQDQNYLLLRQNLKILKSDSDAWNVSRIPGHGQIYWKTPTTTAEEIVEKNRGPQISTDELLKREIVSVSFHPKNPSVGLASAQGIYLTTDGKNWQQLKIFGQKNSPVLISSEGELFVGVEKSVDLGKSFHPFIRWDQLAQMVEKHQGHPNKRLNLKDLANPKLGVLQLQLETDLGKLSLSLPTRQTSL